MLPADGKGKSLQRSLGLKTSQVGVPGASGSEWPSGIGWAGAGSSAAHPSQQQSPAQQGVSEARVKLLVPPEIGVLQHPDCAPGRPP